MKTFLTPLMLFLLFLLLPDGTLSNDCPEGCSCSTPESILCFQRRSSTIPKGMPSQTQSLYLFANGIESFTSEDFDGLENLEMLDLSQNKLTELTDRVFEPLTSLRNLDLSSNQITHISEECFQGMVLLERLYLYSNHIETIHPAAFNGLEHLLELKLQGNQLTSLPALSMPRLLLLDLRFNVLSTLGPSDLQTPNLESLKLGGVGLTSLDKNLLSSLKNLHELDISENKLESFPSALKETQGLIHLSLAGNPIGPLKVQDLQNLGELQELDISSLSLQGLPEEFPQLLPHLKKLIVAENPFNCLCTIAWFPRWLRAQSITLERTEETRCHFPPVSAGKVLERLEHRDFGCPTTTTVTTSTVKTTTTTTLPVPVTTLPSTTRAIPAPKASDDPKDEDVDSPLLPVPASPSSSSIDTDEEQHFCPPLTCLNGGTCRLDQHGQVQCLCPHGTYGMYCEIKNLHLPSPPEADTPVETANIDLDISSHEATATSILLDLHRYIEMRPYIRGIRLTYRNLSGPDRRPNHLSLPASFPEYTLRGLQPNSTYHVCASPLGAPSGVDSVCTEAHTVAESSSSIAWSGEKKLTTMLVPVIAILLLLLLIAIAVGVVCYLRRKKAKGHLDLDCEPSQLELDGVKAGLDNGALPQKQPQLMIPEPAVQKGNLEYEVLLLQEQCTSNNNMNSHKLSYF
ncbi:vasorin b [Gymnodraco acuticeps]|uniref:Vasorin b n=1 Tax=Gymnodraco acuticeps TaxID=8218 RepID=A0A6P8UT27_GYMAC|nr:vasorin b [Gymnodraco acuticeps]